MSTKMVLLPVSLSDGSGLTPGSSEIDAGCGHRCWISPSSVRALLAAPGIRTTCRPCLGMSQIDGMAIVPGGLGELSDLFGPVKASMVHMAVRRTNAKLRDQRKGRKRSDG